MPRTAKTMNVSLPAQLHAFVEAEVAKGLYPSASAVLQDALRLLQREQEAFALKTERLKVEIALGVADLEAGRSMTYEQFKVRRPDRRAERERPRREKGDAA